MSNSLNWNFTWLDVTNGFVFSSKICSFDTPCWFSLRYDDKESLTYGVTGVQQQYLLMGGHLLLLPTAPWTIYVSLDFCAQVFSLKTNYLPLFWGQPKNESTTKKKRDVHFTTKMVFKKNDAETTYIWKPIQNHDKFLKQNYFPWKSLFSRTHKFLNIKGHSIKKSKLLFSLNMMQMYGCNYNLRI